MTRRKKGIERKGSKQALARDPRPELVVTMDRFLIVVEGSRTETRYFEKLKYELKMGNAVIVHHPRVTHPKGLADAALKELEQLNRRAGEPEERIDQVWVVFDRESPESNRGSRIQTLKNDSKYQQLKLAISDPCFEYWFLLHFKKTAPSYNGPKEVERDLKRAICECSRSREYSKSDPPCAELFPRTMAAIKRSRQYRRSRQSELCESPCASTDVDLLVTSLGLSLHPKNREFLAGVDE